MDIARIRLENLERLIAENGGSLRALADAASTSYDNLWQIRNRSPLPSGAPRNVGNRLARKLEEKLGKPVGWMDWDNSAPKVSDAARFIAEQFDQITDPAKKKQLRDIIAATTGWAIPDGEVEQRMPVTQKVRPKSTK